MNPCLPSSEHKHSLINIFLSLNSLSAIGGIRYAACTVSGKKCFYCPLSGSSIFLAASISFPSPAFYICVFSQDPPASSSTLRPSSSPHPAPWIIPSTCMASNVLCMLSSPNYFPGALPVQPGVTSHLPHAPGGGDSRRSCRLPDVPVNHTPHTSGSYRFTE